MSRDSPIHWVAIRYCIRRVILKRQRFSQVVALNTYIYIYIRTTDYPLIDRFNSRRRLRGATTFEWRSNRLSEISYVPSFTTLDFKRSTRRFTIGDRTIARNDYCTRRSCTFITPLRPHVKRGTADTRMKRDFLLERERERGEHRIMVSNYTSFDAKLGEIYFV